MDFEMNLNFTFSSLSIRVLFFFAVKLLIQEMVKDEREKVEPIFRIKRIRQIEK
jgi:hypothetical protein